MTPPPPEPVRASALPVFDDGCTVIAYFLQVSMGTAGNTSWKTPDLV